MTSSTYDRTDGVPVPSTFILPDYEEFLQAVARVARRVGDGMDHIANDLMTYLPAWWRDLPAEEGGDYIVREYDPTSGASFVMRWCVEALEAELTRAAVEHVLRLERARH